MADDLTWREQEILVLLGEHLSNREIANQLHLAESTVKDYVGRIISKLYVKNRRQAVQQAKILGLLNRGKIDTSRTSSNLPAESTSFVGRTNQLKEIRKCLEETRLLTLTGPGGTGKTRLALKAAEAVRDNFRDGCFLVSLARIRTVSDIIQTIAEVLKFPIATLADPQDQLNRYLRKRHTLLILDNFEHLQEGAVIVSQILLAAPSVKILVTSRERLNLKGETIYSVGGMAYPDQFIPEESLAYDAISLFIQRARQILQGFNPSHSQLQHIVSICQIVQGMPLAIELAAAWLHLLNLEEIAVELEKGFDILSTNMRDTPERHRSIRAVFDHSWSLLSLPEREIFTRLSVFRGGFTRPAAQEITGATLQSLADLVNKSFLSHNPVSGRFEIHELLRQYAQEQLEQAGSTRRNTYEAHGAYYASFMEQALERLKDHRQTKALAEIEADIDNIRAAWQYCVEQQNTQQLWQFIYGLWYVYWVRWWNHAGRALFAQAARSLRDSQDPETKALGALAMAMQGYFMGWLDLADQGYDLALEGVEFLESINYPQALIFAYDSLQLNAYFQNRYLEEIDTIRNMVALTEQIGDRWLLAFISFAACMSALLQEDYPKARKMAYENLKTFEEFRDQIGAAQTLVVIGHAAFALGEFEEAKGIYLRCLALSQPTGFHYGLQTASKYLGKTLLSLGNISDAHKYLVQSLKISNEIGFVRDMVNLLVDFARLKMAKNQIEEAVELLAFVIEQPASLEYRMFEGRIRDSAIHLLNQLESMLPKAVFNTAMERGQDLVLDSVVTALIGTYKNPPQSHTGAGGSVENG